MPEFRKLCLAASALGALGVIVGLIAGEPGIWSPSAAVAAISFAIGLGALPSVKSYQYTAWILAAVVVAMVYPQAFRQWGPLELRHKWVILIVVQTVMFGMGTQMSMKDFVGVLKMPWGVMVAVGCQFLVMPLSGWALTKMVPLPDEIAAGVILIGCCSSGLASNVMCYIARANLALSITATAVTTMLAPVMTPFWMKLLAGSLVEVKVLGMMAEIVKIVIVPIGAALLHEHLKSRPGGLSLGIRGAQLGCVAAAVAVFATRGTRSNWGVGPSLAVELLGFLFGAFSFGVLYNQLWRRFGVLESLMPLLSMAGIVYFTTITTAAGRDNLLMVGGLLFIVAALHNGAGYVFGYGLARLAGLDRNSCRTVAIEVGLQNGGMASGIAGGMGKLATVGLAAAVFSPWMNITGSILANHWRRRPVSDSKAS
jgi:bile acid:Na+ symporter, BASS family